MRADDLFRIDVAAEIASLCNARLQGPWQVPAEVIRLASARGVNRVEIERDRGGFRFDCSGLLATPDELRALVEVFDDRSPHARRQRAVTGIETGGLSALLWVAGLPGARARLVTRSEEGTAELVVRRGNLTVAVDEERIGSPHTMLTWRCASLQARKAVSWLRTALRFVPFPIVVCGRPVDSGFGGGMYRMRISDPVPAELAVTRSGEAASLWLLEHGVLAARAVVPGYPPFSAAVEMAGRVPPGASADELRAASNVFLEGLIDKAAQMVLLLVDRMATAEEEVRARLATLLLRFADRGIRRNEILGSPIVEIIEGGRSRMESPERLKRRAGDRGRVLPTVQSRGSGNEDHRWVVVATAEERSLLADLLGIHVERIAPVSQRGFLGWWRDIMRRGWRVIRSRIGGRTLGEEELTAKERRLVAVARRAGIELAFIAGRGRARRRGETLVLGRRRREVRAAARVVAEDADWLYPALLAAAEDELDIPDDAAARWCAEIS